MALRPLHRLEVQTPVGVQTTVNGYAAMVERVGALHAQGLDDTQIAAQLSREGFHSARRSDVAEDAVTTIRHAYRWLDRTGPRPVVREDIIPSPHWRNAWASGPSGSTADCIPVRSKPNT
ncbi:MAG: hypothetical protein IPM84_21390 [Anaerolineae bacterium]|nr:hypothetical protein [Anaerolineae bacterium]